MTPTTDHHARTLGQGIGDMVFYFGNGSTVDQRPKDHAVFGTIANFHG